MPGPLPPNTVRAFPAHPCVDRYFAAGTIEECRCRLMRSIERGDGPALLIGAPGMGKTMLLSVLAESLAERFQVVSIASTQLCTRRALLQAILFGLELPYQDREEGELRLTLINHLQDTDTCPTGAVLLIDEAQVLPVKLLEELRILTNLARNGEPLVRLVLAGGTSLEEQFAAAELESFNQRLAARCYLSAFSYGDTLQYVRAHIAAAGMNPDQTFDQAALDSVYTASDGVPRLINQVCDRAIVLAVEQAAASVDQQLVQAAWSDLHQLPAPWHTEEVEIREPESSVVEFGVLADESPVAEPIASLAAEPLAVEEQPPAGDWNADQALASFAFVPVQPAEPTAESEPAEASVEQTPDAASLFGEGYDEEETVIDRFAGIETVFTSSTPVVSNQQDADFGLELEQHVRLDQLLAEQSEPCEETPSAEQTPSVEETTSCDVLPVEAEVAQLAVEETPAELSTADNEPDAYVLMDDESLESIILPEEEPRFAADSLHATESPVQLYAISDDDSDHRASEDDFAQPAPTEAAEQSYELDTPAAEPAAATAGQATEAAPVDGDVLIIERDPASPSAQQPGAVRREYRQLFSNLRHC